MYKMSFPPSFSLEHQLLAFSFSLIAALLLLRFFGYCICSFSSTLLVLVLPISFHFIFSKIKKFIEANFMEEQNFGLRHSIEEVEEISEEADTVKEEISELKTDEIVLNGECPSIEKDNCSISNENLENLSRDQNSHCSVPGDDVSSEMESSEDSISDDESLIEIALEDEPNAVFHQESKGGLFPEFLPEFSPELLFKKHGLLDLLSEINEEDNMIEIDIKMGSIKCSRVEIKA
ncbi:uncharacterized protein A4U43_C08F19740 [Asparagus officinalis]|uniref:uncharacterized protein LOC109822933 n=1 Tax=Asparagus officinalis TaxID=4686 RepID=UPI00098E64A3|nr:uncharacterized protein LOC109822933 [Asparagus officinalis]XP_020244800.1 uncharacterized protein LOC109822933 [Asparagus officinalis]ONK60547.1 uncharacterized protein A4U43_C08F19740 [Asparagus officinalis]